MLVLGNAPIFVFWCYDIHEEDSDVTDGTLVVELIDGIGNLKTSLDWMVFDWAMLRYLYFGAMTFMSKTLMSRMPPLL